MHPATEHLLGFFKHDHLPDDLAAVVKPFAELAATIADGPANPSTSAALRRLLESKDCAVRAVVAEQTKAEAAERKAANEAKRAAHAERAAEAARIDEAVAEEAALD
jgi:hypothetical protein